jgi:hypothetical protein
VRNCGEEHTLITEADRAHLRATGFKKSGNSWRFWRSERAKRLGSGQVCAGTGQIIRQTAQGVYAAEPTQKVGPPVIGALTEADAECFPVSMSFGTA